MSKRANPHQQIPSRSPTKSHGEPFAQRASKLLHEGKNKEGIEQLRKAVAADPHNPDWQLALGKQLVNNGHYKEGVKYLRETLSIVPDRVSVLVELGQALVSKNHFEEAKPLLTKALQSAPNFSPAHIAYATFLHKQGQLPEAIQYFRSALEFVLSQPAPPPKREDKPSTHGFDDTGVEELMWTTLSQLARAGVHAFPDGGTLLGLVREGRLLPWDKDIDIGIPLSEQKRATACLQAHGWARDSGNFLCNPLAFVHLGKKITLDLQGFAVDPATGHTYYGFWLPDIAPEWNRNLRFPSIVLEKSQTPSGDPIWMLRDPDAQLTAYYGDWRKPDPDFNTLIGEYNLCGMSLLTECYLLGRLYSHWEKGRVKKAESMTTCALRHRPDDELLGRLASHFRKALLAATKGPRSANAKRAGYPPSVLEGGSK